MDECNDGLLVLDLPHPLSQMGLRCKEPLSTIVRHHIPTGADDVGDIENVEAAERESLPLALYLSSAFLHL